MTGKMETIENKHLYLLERIDFVRMNAESLSFQDMHVIAEEIENDLKMGKRLVYNSVFDKKVLTPKIFDEKEMNF